MNRLGNHTKHRVGRKAILLALIISLSIGCKEDDLPDDVFVYEGDFVRATINGEQEFEASGAINGQDLVFSLLQGRIFVATAIDRATINAFNIRLSNFQGVGTYEFNIDNAATYVLFDEDRNSSFFGSQSGQLVVESFEDSIAVGTFEVEVASTRGSFSFTEGEFVLAIQ